MGKKKLIRKLVMALGKKFSTSLGIDLSQGKSEEVFKWFLASILFGARISETIVVNTYKEFEKEKALTPDEILRKKWEGLVRILDNGGYVRYDFKTATKLLEIMKDLKKEYKGDLNNLHQVSENPRDLEEKIKNLGKGIGDITANIFLRELRGIWKKAEPLPSPLVIEGARCINMISEKLRSKSKILERLKSIWQQNKVKGKDFVDFEASLLRLAKDYHRKGKKLPLD
jgi:hypothetical protein